MRDSSSKSKRTAVLNVVGLTPRHIGPHTPHISDFVARRDNSLLNVEPVLPAVTSTAQATYLTGLRPTEHGIVANGWYDRDYGEHFFWKQSNHLVKGRKIWEHLRESDPDYTCAKLFWWNNMYSTADYAITPRPIYCADGKKVFDVATYPLEMRKKVKRKLGKFPFHSFWGPGADIKSSEWIAHSAKWIDEKYSPNLNLVYLPHLDYNLQRIGPDDPNISQDLEQIDTVVGDLIHFYEKRDVQVVLLSEYGITEVDNAIHLNRTFREHGWLAIKDELHHDVLDLGHSKAFAIADHQVAHIYVNDDSILEEVKATVAETPGVAEVIDGSMRHYRGVDNERSGDLIAVANQESWFTYYYWEKDKRAPDFARNVDIHRKQGYDPCELFIDPRIRFPKLKIAGKLLKKTLGGRMMMDVIPLNPSLVKGSHGCIPKLDKDWPVLIGDFPDANTGDQIEAVDVYQHLHAVCSR